MRLPELKQATGGLSKPSKMPGHGYSLPASSCGIGSFLRKNVPGSVCSTCYARKGRYLFGNVRDALSERKAALANPNWEEAMSELIRRSKDLHFRWHDSGDLQSVRHLQKIVRIAQRLSDVSFWLPTKEYGIVERFLESGGEIPENLTIRLSSLLVDVPFKDQLSVLSGMERIPERIFVDSRKIAKRRLPTAAVSREKSFSGHFVCPAPTTAGECGECRACWDRKVAHIAYPKH